jgi:hypothetical protein
MSRIRVDGSCHCGKIAYQAEVDPNAVGICHCTDCQTLTGTAFRANVQAPAATFRLLRGEPKIYVKKTAESGNARAHAFCPDCGTPIYAAALENTPTYSLRIGGLAQRTQFQPALQIWCRSALPWAMNVEQVPQREKQ